MHEQKHKTIIFSNSANEEIPTQALQKLSGSDIRISHGAWKQVNTLSPYISEWKVQNLFVPNNSHPDILKQIRNIQFSFLNSLILNGNDIQSIQPLSYLFIPHLKSLLFGYNNVKSVRSLRKMNAPQLTQLQLNKNVVNQCQRLSDLHIKNLRTLNLEQHFYSDELVSDIMWIPKIQSSNLQFLWIRSQQRINQKKAKKKIKRLFTKLNLYDNR